MKKKQDNTKRISNKRAYFDYELGDSFTVGIVLNGRETKNLRMGHGNLKGAYVTIKEGELWLINATITGSRGIPIDENEVTQARKLLAKSKEIHKIIEAKQNGMTILPTEMLIGGRFIKLKIALGKGKKSYDKRQVIKKRDDTINLQREVKSWR